MVTYKSAKGRTLTVGVITIDTEVGISLDKEDPTYEQLVKEGFLSKESDAKPSHTYVMESRTVA